MTFKHVDTKVGLQPLDATSTTQAHPIGTVAKGYDATYGVGEFVYLKGLASTAVGEVVIFDTYANTTKRGVAGDRGPAAVAMSANAANQYGWYQISGAALVKAAAAFAAGGNVYWTATPGTVDDATVVGDKIDGMRGKTALDTPVAGFAVCQLAYPSANGNG